MANTVSYFTRCIVIVLVPLVILQQLQDGDYDDILCFNLKCSLYLVAISTLTLWFVRHFLCTLLSRFLCILVI